MVLNHHTCGWCIRRVVSFPRAAIFRILLFLFRYSSVGVEPGCTGLCLRQLPSCIIRSGGVVWRANLLEGNARRMASHILEHFILDSV